jgi:hypothetical protein
MPDAVLLRTDADSIVLDSEFWVQPETPPKGTQKEEKNTTHQWAAPSQVSAKFRQPSPTSFT